MKKTVITIVAFIIVIFTIKTIVNYLSSKEFNDNNIKKVYRRGKIVKFHSDFNNHNVPYAILGDGSTLYINFIYNKLKVGDSIIKKKGTTDLIVFRKDSIFTLNLSQPKQ